MDYDTLFFKSMISFKGKDYIEIQLETECHYREEMQTEYPSQKI